MQKKRAAAALLAAAMILGVPAQAGSRGAFSDVPEKHWAFAAIEQAYADGVMTGTYYDAVTGVRQFSPEGSLSMAEWLSMLTRACWPEEVASAPASGSWYAGAVAVAEHHGLLDGVEDVPLEGALTRNAMAVVIRHVLEEQGVAMPDEEALRDTQAKIGDLGPDPRAISGVRGGCHGSGHPLGYGQQRHLCRWGDLYPCPGRCGIWPSGGCAYGGSGAPLPGDHTRGRGPGGGGGASGQ